MSTTYTLKEADEIIQYVIGVNRINSSKGIKKKLAIALRGGAGLGKTSLIHQIKERMAMAYAKVNLAQVEEMGDIIGYPTKDFCIRKDDEEKWVSSEVLPAWFKQGWSPTDKRPVLSYAIPDWISDKGGSGILNLDDYNRADPRILQGSMELIDKGELLSWSLPEDWHVVLTTNPDDGEYLVNSQDKAQETRMMIMDIRYEAEVWSLWAETNHIHTDCINFMLACPEVVKGTERPGGPEPANPRQWTNYFHTISHHENLKKQLSMMEKMGNLCVGQELCATFITHINNNMGKLPDVAKILGAKQTERMLGAVEKAIKPDGTYRADIASILTTRITNALVIKAKKAPIPEEEMANLIAIIRKDILGTDMNFRLVRDLHHENPGRFQDFFTSDDLMKYVL